MLTATPSRIKTWNYIPPILAGAATQMAIDTELGESCNRTPGTAFLRFYRMSPPAVTIGRHQSWRTVVDPDRCRQRGWDWARRPTGGGALLHRNELNYAVAFSHDLLGRNPAVPDMDGFHRVAQGLMAGLTEAGFHPVLNPARKRRATINASSAHGLCGAALTRFEISVDGQKAIAAAQWNLSQASLQHGTIYMCAPAPSDRFWPGQTDPTLGVQNWWAWESVGVHPEDQWLQAATHLKTGLSQILGLEWRDDSTEWPASSSVRRILAQWDAELWHNRR